MGVLGSASPACWVFRPQDVAARRTRFLLPPHQQATDSLAALSQPYPPRARDKYLFRRGQGRSHRRGAVARYKSVVFAPLPLTWAGDLSNC